MKFQRYRLKASFNEFDLPNDFKEKQENVKTAFYNDNFLQSILSFKAFDQKRSFHPHRN